eukprot:scaffold57604_cov112-Phaeocystis_antarctica.AAC.1
MVSTKTRGVVVMIADGFGMNRIAMGSSGAEEWPRSREPPPRQTGDGGLLRLDGDGFSSFVRRKRSERRWAVDQAVGRAKQGRSTWPWSERWPVDASAAEKGGSRARVCRPRAGQHRVPESRPKGETALINMFEPALASLSLRRTALGIVDATRGRMRPPPPPRRHPMTASKDLWR